MYISRITLNNYRIYYGNNSLSFPQRTNKNVFIISGNNGFGKTTLLTSLIWGLYGKLMVDVDDNFRREIYEAGGYKKYAYKNFNRLAKSEFEQFESTYSSFELSELRLSNPKKYEEVNEQIKAKRSYSVSICITDLHIPAIPCNDIEIIRSYDILKNEDSVSILIDGKENELTKEVGDEIFINDFILPKEIAKFFFFDAEKIVSLAEIKSTEEKRSLSKAYSEVLGIKKYEDLKSNLEDLRIRFRRNSASDKDKNKLNELLKEFEQLKKLSEHNQQQLTYWKEERDINRQLSNQLQEKLIREGNSLSVNDLNELKKVKEKLTNEANTLKNKLKELLDIAPFAISGNLFMQSYVQHEQEAEQKSKSLNPAVLQKKASKIANEYYRELKAQKLNVNQIKDAVKSLEKLLSKHLTEGKSNDKFKVLLSFDEKESNEFDAIYNNLKFSFNIHFKQLIKDYRNNRVFFNKTIRKISLAEAKENDLLIKEIRQSKNEVDAKLDEIDKKIMTISQELGSLQKEMSIKSKLVSELSKKVELEEKDREKDETAKRIIGELSVFINSFKKEKKDSLESRMRTELNILMHKKNFINRVEVLIDDEIIDINLYDRRDNLINKESLSKGEQQLYATALLKALVDESNIKFPVFIDSPLQKFDKKHSINIIRDFYPNISEQVVLFPLLEKELSESEFKTLLPKVNRAFLIKNINEGFSTFEEIKPNELFLSYQKELENVYNN